MKKLFLLLAIIMLLPFRGTSQNDTIVYLPVHTARKVVSDLVRLDYTQRLLGNQNRQILLLEQKLLLKDSLIQAMHLQNEAMGRIKSEQENHLVLMQQRLTLEQEKTRKLKGQRSIITTGCIVITLLILIAK